MLSTFSLSRLRPSRIILTESRVVDDSSIRPLCLCCCALDLLNSQSSFLKKGVVFLSSGNRIINITRFFTRKMESCKEIPQVFQELDKSRNSGSLWTPLTVSLLLSPRHILYMLNSQNPVYRYSKIRIKDVPYTHY